MIPLPVITSLGGISPAGRSSAHQGYARLVETALPAARRQRMLESLAGLVSASGTVGTQSDLEPLLAHTLVRPLDTELFDPQGQVAHRPVQLRASSGPISFTLARRQLPAPLPKTWRVVADNGDTVDLVCEELDALLPERVVGKTSSAGQLPLGFDPAALYASRSHPRALQMTVFGASDAINSLGIDWEQIRSRVAPDAISVYAGNCMGQLDFAGFGGLLQARLLGRKVSSKQLPLGYTEMPADFINAYLLGSLGTTGTSVAACATFLYNLRQGIQDIKSGASRVVLVGTSEAPLIPEVFEGFGVMGALADDAKLRLLDGLTAEATPDSRRACRPFGDNCGFTLAESAQFTVLMDDSLALELGATIMGAVSDVFINADGYKKSIASPGVGNYLTLAKATAAARSIVGERSLRERSLVQAHGTGTPQNRVSESAILARVAREFGIDNWQVSAVKAFVGHSLASSAGDQLMSTLGLWQHGVVPGIETVDALAADVSTARLDFVLKHRTVAPESLDVALINSKGFGGNNATATLLAPHVVEKMLLARHGKSVMTAHSRVNAGVSQSSADYDLAASRGEHRLIYKFDNNVLDETALDFNANTKDSAHSVRLGTQRPSIDLSQRSPFADLFTA